MDSFFKRLASIEFTAVCLILMMMLVVLGTVAQVDIGAFAAQKIFFNSFLVTKKFGGFRIPVFPGGLTIGLLWLMSLLTSLFIKFNWSKRYIGLIISHLGVIILILGQGLTQMLAEESSLAIEENQIRNYSELSRELELAIIMTSNSEADQITSIPGSALIRGKTIQVPGLPFSVLVNEFYQNSQLGMKEGSAPSPITQGIGPQIAVQPVPTTEKDDEVNVPSAIIEIKDAGKSLGTWLVSTGLEAPQSFIAGAKKFNVYLRLKRHYFPFSLTLKKFTHDIYPGTDIPKNFSSVVHINYPEKNESRDALIYMNNPLRFDGLTFYQASFGKNDTLSVFQVVQNPVWLTPYISCVMVTVGLLIQFLSYMFSKSRLA